jgi:hypothetical protein
MATAPAKAKAPVIPLPKALIDKLPAATEIVGHLEAIKKLLPQLDKQMQGATKKGAIPLAQSFCVFHRMMSVMDERIKPVKALFDNYKILIVPKVLEDSGVTSVPLDFGYRVQVSYATRASIRPEVKVDAQQWLRDNYPDVLSETVNASTLSALARELHENKNIDLPDKFFNVALVPNTSVVKT